MNCREKALRDLIGLCRPLDEIANELSAMPWDSAELVTLDASQIISVLDRFLRGEIDSSVLENWANAIEGRDDIAIVTCGGIDLHNIVYQLANPLLTQPIDQQRISKLVFQIRGLLPVASNKAPGS